MQQCPLTTSLSLKIYAILSNATHRQERNLFKFTLQHEIEWNEGINKNKFYLTKKKKLLHQHPETCFVLEG
jgi:hypothetical protein